MNSASRNRFLWFITLLFGVFSVLKSMPVGAALKGLVPAISMAGIMLAAGPALFNESSLP